MKNLLRLALILVLLAGCSPQLATPGPDDLPPPTAIVLLSTATPSFNQCPEQNKELVPEFGNFFNKAKMYDPSIKREIEKPVLDFLNKGGSPDKVIDAFAKGFEENGSRFFQQDLTNNNVPELIIDDFLLHIFGCKSGKYESILKIDPGGAIAHSNIFLIQDMNLNGSPDLIISEWRGDINLYVPEIYRIMEWDGAHFKDLITQPDFESRYGGGGANDGHVWIDGVWSYTEIDEKQVEVSDIDNNGTLEFILRGGLPTHPDTRAHGPWRAETDIYFWNGKGFVIYSVEPATPTYRFQAVQDADYALFDKNYEKALALYQDVISNEELEWWSNDRWFHESQGVQTEYSGLPSPTPLPANDSEYQYLSAYSYYRMMTIYAELGNISEAKMIYGTLTEKYFQGKEGFVISELATVFWDEFLTSNNMSNACSKAIDFTNKNPFEIFNYVGFIKTNETYDWITHGWQKEYNYTVNDICPFK